jgi:hypothetical protein
MSNPGSSSGSQLRSFADAKQYDLLLSVRPSSVDTVVLYSAGLYLESSK